MQYQSIPLLVQLVAAMVSEINMVHLSALLLDQYDFRDQHSFYHQLELLNQLRLRKQLTQRVSYSSMKIIQKSLICVLNIIVGS
jgi:hypothetical protein